MKVTVRCSGWRREPARYRITVGKVSKLGILLGCWDVIISLQLHFLVNSGPNCVSVFLTKIKCVDRNYLHPGSLAGGTDLFDPAGSDKSLASLFSALISQLSADFPF